MGRERTTVIHTITKVRTIKSSWARHINHLKDDRKKPRITTSRPYDKKLRKRGPAMRWIDDMDNVSNSRSRWGVYKLGAWLRHGQCFQYYGKTGCNMRKTLETALLHVACGNPARRCYCMGAKFSCISSSLAYSYIQQSGRT